jgi:hypothetical protein
LKFAYDVTPQYKSDCLKRAGLGRRNAFMCFMERIASLELAFNEVF